MQRVKGKIALVTGAARGIGLATAALLAREGATVIVSDIDEGSGQDAAARLPVAAEYRHLDVSREADWRRMAGHLEDRYGGLDILVNNAGITGFLEAPGPFDPEHLDLASWHRVMAVNADGVALGCRTAIGLMKNRAAGSIVNISSRSGLVGIPAAAAYAASKAAVRNHSKTVALYCAERGYPIRCNSVHPGAILTPMWDAMLGDGEERQAGIAAVEAGIPLGAMGEPADVAHAVLYLASDESRYVTGIELNVDGGILAGSAARPEPA